MNTKKLIIFLFLHFLFSKEETKIFQDPKYQLFISSGNNYFDQGELDKALLDYKKAIKISSKAADAYLQIGHVHLVKGLNLIALKYFKKAEKYKDFFITKEETIELYTHLAVVYHRLKYFKEEKKALFSILDQAQNGEGLYYQKKAGWANFAIALNLNKTAPVESLKHFLQATQDHFRAKLAYLYISHYYCITSQEIINKNNKNYYNRINKPHKYKTENKSIFFSYYYDKYLKTKATQDEQKILSSSKAQAYITDCQSCIRQIEIQKNIQRNEKLKRIQNETR